MIYHIKDFIKDGKNCTPAFVAAVAGLAEGDTLLLDGGVYHLYPEGAFEKEYYISNNDCGIKPIAIPLIGKRNVTVDGCGAELIFHGKMNPIVIDRSENVTVKGVAIDYHTPFYAQAKIVEAGDEGVLLGFDGKDFNCRVQNGNFCFYSPADGWEWEVESALSLEFDENGHPSASSPPYFPYTGKPKDHGFLGGMFQDMRLEERGKNLIMMYGHTGEHHTVGNHFIMTFSSREYPGIFATEAKDVFLSDIKLYHTASMGVIAQMTENVFLDRIVAEPREGSGRLLSVNADATHFVNCRGKISQTNCKYVQMMDDAANIHGIYHLYQGKNADGSLKLGFGHFQQKGIQTYRVGDEVEVIDSVDLTVKARGRVVEAELVSPDEVRLLLDCPVPEAGEYDVVENVTTAPDVYFADCESGYNRPRGFLLSSMGRILVERCKFYNMNQGIQLSGEMKDWYESGSVKDVTVRDCEFRNASYAGGVAIYCRPALRCNDKVFNGTVVIENNTFTQATKRICAVDRCQKVVFRGNRFVRDESMPPKHPHGELGYSFDLCDSVCAEPMKEDV
jgi:hypothetical protein